MTAAKDAQPHPGETARADATMSAEVLCAIDGTTESLPAVEQAAALARTNGHLTLRDASAMGASLVVMGSRRPQGPAA